MVHRDIKPDNLFLTKLARFHAAERHALQRAVPASDAVLAEVK
jgi:serine/threonine protein kinase